MHDLACSPPLTEGAAQKLRFLFTVKSKGVLRLSSPQPRPLPRACFPPPRHPLPVLPRASPANTEGVRRGGPSPRPLIASPRRPGQDGTGLWTAPWPPWLPHLRAAAGKEEEQSMPGAGRAAGFSREVGRDFGQGSVAEVPRRPRGEGRPQGASTNARRLVAGRSGWHGTAPRVSLGREN